MRYPRIAIFLMIAFLFSLQTVFSEVIPDIQVRVFFDTKEQWIKLKEMHLDVVYKGASYLEIITDQEEFNQLFAKGFRIEVVYESVSGFYQTRLAKTRDMGGYKTLSEIYTYLDDIVFDHPGIVSSKVNIGSTIEGRPMWAVKISDNPNVNENEPEVLYTAAIHAREVITPEVLFYFMDYLTDNYGINDEVSYLVDNRELWFVLVVNPDGYYHNQVIAPNGGGSWRKNRRNNGDGTYGVDLNRNFGYMWGYDNSGSSPVTSDLDYRGTAPFSEPETQNMRDFISSHNFVITIYYHSYSNLFLWPWGYDEFYTPDQDIFSVMGDTVHSFNNYTPEPGWGLYVTNGSSDDWGYGEQTSKNKNFAVTTEVGSGSDGFWPPLSRIPALVAENLQPNLFLARIAGNIYSFKPPQAPQIILEDTVPASSYNVSWILDDTLNPAIFYELVEMSNYQIVKDSVANFNNWTNQGFVTTSARSHSSPYSFYSGAVNNAQRYFQFKNPLLVGANDSLKFWTYYALEKDWDFAYVEISTDGINFTPIPGNITTNENLYGRNRGNGITDSSYTWVEGLFDLSSFAGQWIFLRFSYYTDEALIWGGFYVDDIYPVPKFGTETVISSFLIDTIYHFTNKPEGAYYYKVRAKDEQNQWGAFSPLAQTYALSPFVCGDANDDNLVDIQDIVYLIDFVFYGGAEPIPVEAGDVNNDGIVDIGDIVYLINYVFYDGPEPNCE